MSRGKRKHCKSPAVSFHHGRGSSFMGKQMIYKFMIHYIKIVGRWMWSNFLKLGSTRRLHFRIKSSYGDDTANTSQTVHNLDAYILILPLISPKTLPGGRGPCLFHNNQLWLIRRSQTIVYILILVHSGKVVVPGAPQLHCVGHLNRVPTGRRVSSANYLASCMPAARLIMWLHRTVWSAGYIPRCTGWTFQCPASAGHWIVQIVC